MIDRQASFDSKAVVPVATPQMMVAPLAGGDEWAQVVTGGGLRLLIVNKPLSIQRRLYL